MYIKARMDQDGQRCDLVGIRNRCFAQQKASRERRTIQRGPLERSSADCIVAVDVFHPPPILLRRRGDLFKHTHLVANCDTQCPVLKSLRNVTVVVFFAVVGGPRVDSRRMYVLCFRDYIFLLLPDILALFWGKRRREVEF